jgi:hypothetical protein
MSKHSHHFAHLNKIFFKKVQKNIVSILLCWNIKQLIHQGRAIVQVVSRRSLTPEARVRARFIPCGIRGVRCGTCTVFSPSSSVSLSILLYPGSVHTHISPGDEQRARWWPQFRDTFSRHRHEQQLILHKEISGFHGSQYECDSILGYCTVSSVQVDRRFRCGYFLHHQGGESSSFSTL